MSGIVLSASVRQNLLSLQSTAALLATTQNDLATGNKVNTALDNPTNFFTAQGLNNRASDISSLLDSIGNGVQVLQAANTGITSLESLVQSAQSVATQALQTTVGYSTKSSFTVALGSGATAANLFGGSTFSASTLTGLTADTTATTATAITGTTSLTFATNANAISATINAGDTLTVDGHLITFATGAPPTTTTVTPDSGVVTGHTNVTHRRQWRQHHLSQRRCSQHQRPLDRGRSRHRCPDSFDHRRCCCADHHDRRHPRYGHRRPARDLDRYGLRPDHQLEQYEPAGLARHR